MKPQIVKRWNKQSMSWEYSLQVGVVMTVDNWIMGTSSGAVENWTARAMVEKLKHEVAQMQLGDITIVPFGAEIRTPRFQPGLLGP